MAVTVTTRERVKRRLDDEQDPSAGTTSQRDLLLDELIAAVTADFERFLQLPIASAAQTEVHSPEPWQSSLWLKTYFGAAMPVPTITSVKTRSGFTTAWADATTLDASTYALSSDQPGLLLYDGEFPVGSDTVQVVLAASGFAATTPAFLTAYPGIADAADLQVAWEYRRRREPGQSSTAIDGMSSTQQEIRRLRVVEEKLYPYRRPTL